MERRMLLLIALFPGVVVASFPLQASLTTMAQHADHILIGHTVEVDMMDREGNRLVDPEGMTGPGLNNTIRLHIQVDKVLVTNAKTVPKVLTIPLDPFMHYGLGQVKAAESANRKPRLILLRGPAFQPILAGVFSRPLADKNEALRLHKQLAGTRSAAWPVPDPPAK
jgi:hypothetical protein